MAEVILRIIFVGSALLFLGRTFAVEPLGLFAAYAVGYIHSGWIEIQQRREHTPTQEK